MNIQRYPTFNTPIIPLVPVKGTSAPDNGSTRAIPVESFASVVEMSDHAAMTDDPTIRAKEASVRPVTAPPNHMTSP